jgi:hypothetical protein
MNDCQSLWPVAVIFVAFCWAVVRLSRPRT